MSAEAAYNALRAYKREATGQPLAGLTDDEFAAFQAVIGRWEAKKLPAAQKVTEELLTARGAMELIAHEAIVQEAYKDSKGVWTWGIGVTNASGHTVHPRYKDNPQPIRRCLEVFMWLLRERYIPGVAKAFEGYALTEAQFAAALSFHYNTGAIGRASWVDKWKRGHLAAARTSFLTWNKPPEIIGRRTKERDLFFDGTWTTDCKATVYPVRKPSYSPDWRNASQVDVLPILKELLP